MTADQPTPRAPEPCGCDFGGTRLPEPHYDTECAPVLQAAMEAIHEQCCCHCSDLRNLATPEPTAPERPAALLRQARDLLPTVPAVRCYCGNLTGPHTDPGCGAPAAAWGEDAWAAELLARRVEEGSRD